MSVSSCNHANLTNVQCVCGPTTCPTCSIMRVCATAVSRMQIQGSLHGGVSMDDPVVAKVAAKHNVSNAIVMLRFVTQQHITVVTASDSPRFDEKDMGMFELTLDSADMAALDGLQGGKVRTCSIAGKTPAAPVRLH